jgi:hypothetical protein
LFDLKLTTLKWYMDSWDYLAALADMMGLKPGFLPSRKSISRRNSPSSRRAMTFALVGGDVHGSSNQLEGAWQKFSRAEG